MKSENKIMSILAAISAVVGVVLVLCVKVFAPVCKGMLELVSGKQVFMKCHYTATVCVFLGILLAINGVVALVKKQHMSCGIMMIALAVFAILAFHDSYGIGICMKPEMACHTTAPLVKVCATVELLIGAIMCYLARKEG